MNFADKGDTKRYCIRGKHVAILCGAVVAVGLIVGLSVGLTRSCDPAPAAEPPADPTEGPTEGPPEDQGACPASEDASGPWTGFRLPRTVVPEHYDLEVRPELEQDTYTGNVTITLRLNESASFLWLHLRETRLTRVPELQTAAGARLAVARCFEYRAQEFVVLEAAAPLPVAQYRLRLEFAGRLDGSLVGFYRTTYTDGGRLRSIAATDHEPTDARKSFPCFDEPNKKATYTISIVHPNEYDALSNMPVEKKEPVEDGWTRTTFEKSVPMSTYLVCFAVHQFTSIQKISNSGKPLTIYVQPQQKHTAEYAANITKIVFDYFEEYFAMNYSLPKLDQIAIPDFGTGAMENWGLITYRETNLLYDPEQSASSNQQRVAAVIAHELVHQWFGNIVTMDWWDDLWLNEGFASFFEFLGVNQAERDWQMLDQVLLEDVLPVQEDDSLVSSHPVVVSVATPAEITSVFDGISYSKGASILRMLEDWMTPERFQEGCQVLVTKYHAVAETVELHFLTVLKGAEPKIYLEKFQFKNAKTSDFWEALEQAVDLPIREVMDTWTSQMGYPVVTVSNGTSLTQKRFLLDARADPSQPPSDLGYTWNIPVKWTENNVSNIVVYNRSEKEGITLNSSGNAFLKINPDHIGFYRVNYEVPTWGQIASDLSSNPTNFSSADRASFIDDAFALAKAQLLNYAEALNLTKYLIKERDYLPWQRAISAVTYIISMFEDDPELYPLIEEYFQSQVKPIADSLGWTDTGDHLTKLLRASVLGFACKMGDKEALNKASELFEAWVTRNESIPVNLRLLAYRYGMQNSGDEASWNYMLEQYQRTSLAQEKEKLLYGLASVKNVSLLARYLDMLKDPSLIKSQDVFTVIRYISYNSYGKIMAWNWIQLNWDYLVDRYTINDRYLGRIVTIAEPFNTELQLWQVESFFGKYPDAGAGEKPREQVLETVKTNIEWLKENRNAIKEWFFDLPKNG